MRSAFGVEHGEISKGIPGALREGGAVGRLAGPKAFNRRDYMTARKTAHLAGRRGRKSGEEFGHGFRGASRWKLQEMQGNVSRQKRVLP